MVQIKRLNHASFRIIGAEKTIYIDPYEINSKKKADIILVTHPHFDHFSPQDINSIKGKGSVLIAPSSKLCPGLKIDLYSMRSGESYVMGGVRIQAVPSYNIGKHYHPRANGWLGYIIEIDGKRIYHAGDTDLIPEMNDVTDIDYALLPISGKYTMDPEQAARAASIIRPKVAVPMHYGAIFGDFCDVDLFKSMCECRVETL